MISLVIDTSVFIDLVFIIDPKRSYIAEKLFNLIHEMSIEIFAPFLFKVELVGILSRRLQKDKISLVLNEILKDVKLIPNPDDIAYDVAFKTSSRACDAYFISAAKLTNSILITFESYYLIEECKKVINRIRR